MADRTCEYCTKIFDYPVRLQRHLNSKNGCKMSAYYLTRAEKNENVQIATEFPKSSLSLSDASVASVSVKTFDINKIINNELICQYCNFEFKKKDNFIRHIRLLRCKNLKDIELIKNIQKDNEIELFKKHLSKNYKLKIQKVNENENINRDDNLNNIFDNNDIGNIVDITDNVITDNYKNKKTINNSFRSNIINDEDDDINFKTKSRNEKSDNNQNLNKNSNKKTNKNSNINNGIINNGTINNNNTINQITNIIYINPVGLESIKHISTEDSLKIINGGKDNFVKLLLEHIYSQVENQNFYKDNLNKPHIAYVDKSYTIKYMHETQLKEIILKNIPNNIDLIIHKNFEVMDLDTIRAFLIYSLKIQDDLDKNPNSKYVIDVSNLINQMIRTNTVKKTIRNNMTNDLSIIKQISNKNLKSEKERESIIYDCNNPKAKPKPKLKSKIKANDKENDKGTEKGQELNEIQNNKNIEHTENNKKSDKTDIIYNNKLDISKKYNET
jgi:hypothetical protein